MCSSPPIREALPPEVRSAVASAVSRKSFGSKRRVLSETDAEPAIGVWRLVSAAVPTDTAAGAGTGAREASVLQPIANKTAEGIASNLTIADLCRGRREGIDARHGSVAWSALAECLRSLLIPQRD